MKHCICKKSGDYSAYLDHDTKTYEGRNFFLVWCECSCNCCCFYFTTCKDGLLCPAKDRKLTNIEYNELTGPPNQQMT